MRAKLGFGLLYVVTIAMILGGVGDLVIREPLEVHRRFLLGGGEVAVSPQTASLVVHLLHALGGGLVGVGSAALALLHYGLRRGQRWAGFAILAAVVPAETMNAVGMYAVNSFYYVSVAYLVLVILGVALVLSAGDQATLRS